MNRYVKRLALPLGAAAILGSSGFAYMANNQVQASSLGESTAAVTGYSVTGINYSSQQGWGKPFPIFSTSAAKFVLTSNATTAPANAQPATVQATLVGTSATSNCTIVGWSINSSGQGTSAIVCQFASPPDSADVIGLDVFASQ